MRFFTYADKSEAGKVCYLADKYNVNE